MSQHEFKPGPVSVCKLCGSGTGELTRECPGHLVDPFIRQAVHKGSLDFYDGKWTAKPVLMPKKRIPNHEVFLMHLTTLINNLLIYNVNYVNSYYMAQSKSDLLDATKERAQHILDEIEKTKHLIEDD